MKFNSIIVDDDILARKSIARLCEKSDHITLVETFEDGHSALDYLTENTVDLIFLDIEMPGLTGLELLEKLTSMPQVIVSSSNKEYAYDALEYEVTDFLKKPLSQPRFFKAIEKAITREEQLNSIALSSAKHEIYIKTDGKYIRIPYDDIRYFENVGDYIKIITESGTHVFHGALKTINARLDHPRLLKVHRSFIVNLDKVVDIEDSSISIGKKVIPISRAHRPIVLKSLNIIN